MSNGHGGYRQPSNPAPASGPGKLSKRTDGGPGQKLMAATGQAYGDHQAQINQERSAPLAQAGSPPKINVPAGGPPVPGASASGPPQLPDFGAPTARPHEPITHGVDIGPGAGPEVLPLTAQPNFQQQGPMAQLLQGLAPSDTSGVLADLYQSAISRGA